jgi:hypothetical protein
MLLGHIPISGPINGSFQRLLLLSVLPKDMNLWHRTPERISKYQTGLGICFLPINTGCFKTIFRILKAYVN